MRRQLDGGGARGRRARSATRAGRSPTRAAAARPRDPWLEPDVSDVAPRARAGRARATWWSSRSASSATTSRCSTISTSRRGGRRRVARDRASTAPPTVNDHPAFIAMLADLVAARSAARVKLVVVGGGIAGLAAAHRAVELARERGRPLELTLLEAGDRLGGTIADRAPRRLPRRVRAPTRSSPRSRGRSRSAGGSASRTGWSRTDDRFRRTFVAFRGRLHPLPDGFQLLAPTRLGPFVALARSSRGPASSGWRSTSCCRAAAIADESLGAFVRRRLGREALERVAQPLVAGIYTADPDELSLARHHAALPRARAARAERHPRRSGARRGGRRRDARGRAARAGRSSSRFAEGMEELVRAAGRPAAARRGAAQGARDRGVERATARGWRVATADGAAVDGRRASSSPPESHQAARAAALRRSRRSRTCSTRFPTRRRRP